MLAKRLLASSLMIAILIGGLALDVYVLHMDLCFLAIVAVLMLGGCHEFYRLAENEGAKPFRKTGLLSCLVLLGLLWAAVPHGSATWPRLSNTLNPQAPWLGLAAAVMLPFVLAMRRSDLTGALRDVAVTVMGVIYIWFLCGFMLLVRHIGVEGIDFGHAMSPPGAHWLSLGQRLMVAVVVAAKMVDTGGYTVGKLIGRHKLIPTVSPGKTVEGMVGGMVFSIGGIAFMKSLGFLNEFTWTHAVLFAVVVGLAGMFGDLAESVLKRSSATKDAGAFVPGFGGVLDVIDSFMFACPVAYGLVWLIFALQQPADGVPIP